MALHPTAALPARTSPPPRCALLWLLAALPGLALAQPSRPTDTVEPPPPDGRLTYALGGALIAAPTYAGGSSTDLKPRPLWALRYGRLRLSGARSSGLLARPGDAGSGASADLIDEPRWRLGTSLRIDQGRNAGDDPALQGLPEIRRTLRGRLYASFDLAGRWSAGVGYGRDLLGRVGGGTANAGLAYALPLAPGIDATLDLGLNLADGRYMRTYYGVTPEVAAATGRTAFTPRAGVMDWHLGLSARAPMGGRWTLIGGLGLSRLQGDAAASPLTSTRTGATATVALAWRSR